MKKNLLTFVVALFTLSCMAQEHLSFKGIPIEGSMTEFCNKLEQKGFVKLEHKDGNSATMFVGEFVGSEAIVGVNADDNGENVFSVAVIFQPSGEWKVLTETYDFYKNLYIRKYGKPTQVEEINMAQSDNNTSLMVQLNDRKATWASLWEITGGEIELYIEKTETLMGAVVIRYRDAQNKEAVIQKYLEDI